ncbi:aminoglycoside phosphotransferase family protein [Cyanobium sp. HWJ4-Hawea]|uniref:phosphotransferase enzyme family protein n=1 Tax=Cyanobium sp. HWJ4-Hawea TaxID=2823713 RepID=UPI0020CE65BD|nr:aminoglycoside phosphotransferase family protein [Cyanobium sp. HWJ4-Hawea]MCP9809309.1 aminoglycoside phosphotransferase family protein [Cyanobium sp. HWJ4-Hawea]
MVSPSATLLEALSPIASRFALPAPVVEISPLGRGNVNDTYLVVTAGKEAQRFVLQKINQRVFPRCDLVMQNIQQLVEHGELLAKSPNSWLHGERWQVPRTVAVPENGQTWLEVEGETWRLLTFVEKAHSLEILSTPVQAREIGRGLGLFHRLVSGMPAAELHDTLPGFHITPLYLQNFKSSLAQARSSQALQANQELEACLAFVAEREQLAPVLEAARERGELRQRPIHGDPKINNVMLCSESGCAIALVDLDTVKPGLLHYDIGDCCRSACNPLGEETRDFSSVVFDLERCEAILEGYCGAVGDTLSAQDFNYIYTAIRLISFELGLRFLTDHLAGNTYFKVSRPGHNLDRARVQFQLTKSIESQQIQIEAIIEKLRR